MDTELDCVTVRWIYSFLGSKRTGQTQKRDIAWVCKVKSTPSAARQMNRFLRGIQLRKIAVLYGTPPKEYGSCLPYCY